jgi:hypothetical protein
MDFGRILEELARFLDARDHRWALIGGLALAAYGLARTTLDLDVLTEAEAQDDVVAFLEGLGYETLYRSSGYSNHEHPNPARGRVDLVYVRGETSEQLFTAARRRSGPRGMEVPVPKPEHLAAMKVQAMKNDPARTFQELADIRHLLGLPGVDRGEIRGYFEKHGLLDRYREIRDES